MPDPEKMPEGTAPSGTQTDQPPSPPLPSAQQKKRQTYVIQYLLVLFAAAFLLLLVTYLMERRESEQLAQQNVENQEQIESLHQQSNSALQSLDNLYAENDSLKAKVEELEKDLEQTRADLAQQQLDTEAEREKTEKTVLAIEWFYELRRSFDEEDTERCAEITEIMEADKEDPLTGYLPTENVTGDDTPSLYDQYMSLKDQLTEEEPET